MNNIIDFIKYYKEHIPKELKDNTTIVKNHTLKTYIFCVLLRIILGLFIITNKLSVRLIVIICIFIILGFLNKYFKLNRVWKIYLRTVLVYSIVLLLSVKYNNQYNHISGTLIIIDALMGLQSRHIFDRIGSVINK